MNIISTTINAFILTLTEPQVRALLADLPPESAFCGPLNAALTGAGGSVSPKPQHKGRKSTSFGRRMKASPKGAPAKIAHPCPVCGKNIAYLPVHLKNKHPDYKPQ